MLLVLLVNVDMKVVLRNYVVVAGILVVGVFLLSLVGMVPNLQYNSCGSYSKFVWVYFILRILHHIASIYFLAISYYF